MRQLYVLALAIVGSVVVASTAHAEKSIVVESHVGPRRPDADTLLKPVFDALRVGQYEVGSQMVGSDFETRVSRPAAAALPKDFAAQVERAHKAWQSGKFEDAAQALEPLIKAAHANPGNFADDQTLLEPMQKALVVLALSRESMGDSPAMRETFSELARAFPTVAVSRSSYGPDAVAKFEAVKQQLDAGGTGKLTITTSGIGGGGTVFIDEKIVKNGTITRDVVPGTYRVFAQFGTQLSRVHVVTVQAHDDLQIEIDQDFDATVHSGPDWVGLQFDSDAQREQHEADYAADFATGVRAGNVAIVGIDTSRGRPVVFGSLLNPHNGREIRRANVAIEPTPSDETLKSLGSFILDSRTAVGLDIEVGDGMGATGDEHTAGPGPAPHRGGGAVDDAGRARWKGWPVITGVIAIGGLTAGGVLLARAGDCSDQDPAGPCKSLYSSAPGWSTLGGGVLFTGITIYLIATSGHHHGKHADQRSAFVVPTSGGAFAGLVSRF